MNQNQYHPQGMQGYGGTGQTGFTSPQQYTTPQVPYAQGTDPGYVQEPPQGGYPQYNPSPAGQQPSPYGGPAGYSSVQGGYSMPPQNANAGSFIPQTPYSPGYTSPGYQPPQNGYTAPQGTYPPQANNGYPNAYPPQQPVYQPQPGYQTQPGYPNQPGTYSTQAGGYMPGYNPYGQMGRIPQQPGTNDPGSNIPLNGAGYVPQRVPVRKRGFEFRDWFLIAAGAVLIALFVAAVLIVKSTPLKILLMLLSVGSAAVLWLKPLTAENKRLTYSILALALCVLTAVSFLMKAPEDTTKTGGNTSQNTGSDPAGNSGGSGVSDLQVSANNGVSLPASETTPETEESDTALKERLVSFFSYWHGNLQDEMLALCSPSWQAKEENPRTSLFHLLANRTPEECTLETVSGTDADSSRKVTVTVKMSRNNGKPSELYRMTIMMTKENNEWYIDPQSLKSNEVIETPDPNVTPTPAPTETPAVYSNTVLYYNPKNGEYYHLDPNCKIINPKFLPLAGSFTYSQINDEPYSKLKPCNVCGAPLRP